MMTPEPDGGFYKDADVEAFIRKFGYADKNDKPDRLNFGGRHVVGVRCPPTVLTMRLAQRTDSLRLLRAFASGAMYYDPGIKLEKASTEKPKQKKRSQFRVASKNIAALYERVETVEV
jgi:hypothetical protein